MKRWTPRSAMVLIVSAALASSLLVAAPASAAPSDTVVTAAPTITAQAFGSSGINDWSCRPSAAHPEPVILLHGLTATKNINWVVHGPAIASQGYCVFSLTYGKTIYGPFGGFASMRDSAAEVGAFVDQVLAATGAAQVSLVGHSEGTTVAAYYLKFTGGAPKVKNFVGFGSNFQGTTLWGLSSLARILQVDGLLDAARCQACSEFLPGSQFLADLNAGGVTVPGPHYTSIVSKYDEVVTPYTSGVLAPAENVTNITLQNVCRFDPSGHILMAANPRVSRLILNALDPSTARQPLCLWRPRVADDRSAGAQRP